MNVEFVKPAGWRDLDDKGTGNEIPTRASSSKLYENCMKAGSCRK